METIKLDYRTIVWSIGGSFLLVIIFAEISRWINLNWDIAKILIIFITLFGFILGFYLDQYYKIKEANLSKP